MEVKFLAAPFVHRFRSIDPLIRNLGDLLPIDLADLG
jgi:hypothetical protein